VTDRESEGDMPAESDREFARLTDILTPWAVRVAATLRVADLVHDGTTRAEDIAVKAGADPDAVARLLRYLAARGFFRQVAPGEFALTDLAGPLLDTHPAGRRARLDLDGMGGRIDGAGAGLLQAVRTGRPAYSAVFGAPFWEDIEAHPEMSPSFDDIMAGHLPWFGEVVAGHSWQGVRHVVDVGGGTGALLAAVLLANPDIRGTLVDQAATVAEGREFLAAQGLADRTDAVAGDFFEELPGGADVYLLSNILHDWSDDDAVRILRRCAEAAGPTGATLIADRVVDRTPDSEMVTTLDLRMLVLLGGRERGHAEWSDLVGRAGLRVASTESRAGGATLLSCVSTSVTS
jgi:hypothetical protein